MTEAPEMQSVEHTVRIAAAPEVFWQYWVDPERMSRWWGEARLDPRPGGEYRVEMEEAGPVMVGEYVALEPYRRIVFTFGWDGNAPGTPLAPGSTRVEVTLEADGDDTVLTLRHTDMPATHAPDHEKGWAHFLAILAERVATDEEATR